MQRNSFGVSYSTISFMEKVLDSRNGILTYKRTKDIVFHVKFDNSNEYVFVLVSEYILSAVKVMELHLSFPEVQYIVLGGNWMSATEEAHSEANSFGIKILLLKQFIASLHTKRLP